MKPAISPKRPIAGAVAALLLALNARAQAPEGYYDDADHHSSSTLRASLHEIIDDHLRYPYTSYATDTWDVLEIADQDRDDPFSIVTLYRNRPYLKRGGGNDHYNREHTWPKSYGFPDNGPELNYPYTDMHHLFLSDADYNFQRSNKPFDDCGDSCTEWPTEFNDGRGGSGLDYPGDSNWTEGEYTDGRWEVWEGRKGDIARAMFYMDLRYEGGIHGITGAAEPDLVLTDDRDLIDQARTNMNEPVAYMGLLSALLRWNRQDPVDAIEMQHHETVAAYQGNRNPFVDHPEWADCLFLDVCSVVINSGMNDAWLNPDTPGQGVLLTVLPGYHFMFLAMFTFETERPAGDIGSNLGEAGHRWLTAAGGFEGSVATLEVEITTGGVFGQALPAVEQSPGGTFVIQFSDCSHAQLHYDMPGSGLQGTIPLVRAADDNAGLCKTLNFEQQAAAARK